MLCGLWRVLVVTVGISDTEVKCPTILLLGIFRSFHLLWLFVCFLLFRLLEFKVGGVFLQSNDRGKFFPIFAICLGYEALVIIASGNISYFSQLYDDDLDRRRVLSFKADANNSVLFGSGGFSDQMATLGKSRGPPLDGMKRKEGETIKEESETKPEAENGGRDLAILRSTFSLDAVKGLLATHPIAYFHHYRHLSAEEFHKDQILRTEWNLLATAKLPRENFLEVVAAVEHKK